jgi:hypothetical protein
MRRHVLEPITALSIGIAIAASPVPVAAAEAPPTKSVVMTSGAEFAPESWASYSSALVSVGGDIAKPGIVLNGFLLGGQYSYDTDAVAAGNVDADFLRGHVMVGYAGVFGQLWWGAYAGVDVENHDLEPGDPTNAVSGTETGFKIANEMMTVAVPDVFAYSYFSYSTAFDTYYMHAQVGPRFHDIAFGVEGVLLGDEEWSGQRIGSFVRLPFDLGEGAPGGTLMLSGGYQYSDDEPPARGNEGAYGTLGVKFLF